MLLLHYFFTTMLFGVITVLTTTQNHFASKISVRNLDTLPQVVGVDREFDTTIFQKADVAASVDRWLWKSHLERNLSRIIDKAAKKKMPVGTYTVHTRFLVEKNGSLSDIVVLNDPGYEIKEGILRIFRNAPRWTPGSRNGKPVRSYYTQPLTFIITDK